MAATQPQTPLNVFYNECITDVLESLQDETIMDILSDPEYAMLYVIPGLVFLNDMYPANKTLRNVDGRLQYHTCKKSGAKWYPLEMHQAKPLLLKNVTLQLRKVVDYARNKRMLSKMSPVKACFLLHFLEICESGKPMEISENYPGYAEALGYVCFRYGKLDPDILAGYLYQGLTAALVSVTPPPAPAH